VPTRVGWTPPTLFCWMIELIMAVAIVVADVCRVVFVGSEDTPESTNAFAAPRAAASAARCISLRAT
jgi:hypothetical protein